MSIFYCFHILFCKRKILLDHVPFNVLYFDLVTIHVPIKGRSGQHHLRINQDACNRIESQGFRRTNFLHHL